jgi:hypothetical protein
MTHQETLENLGPLCPQGDSRIMEASPLLSFVVLERRHRSTEAVQTRGES